MDPLKRTLQASPIDTVYGRIARQLQDRSPGWTVWHDVTGYHATRAGMKEPVGGTCAQAVEAQMRGTRPTSDTERAHPQGDAPAGEGKLPGDLSGQSPAPAP